MTNSRGSASNRVLVDLTDEIHGPHYPVLSFVLFYLTPYIPFALVLLHPQYVHESAFSLSHRPTTTAGYWQEIQHSGLGPLGPHLLYSSARGENLSQICRLLSFSSPYAGTPRL